jgi:hypothetical protein
MIESGRRALVIVQPLSPWAKLGDQACDVLGADLIESAPAKARE